MNNCKYCLCENCKFYEECEPCSGDYDYEHPCSEDCDEYEPYKAESEE